MKKRNKNIIIIGFIINVFVFIILVLVTILYIYPEIITIENDKKELINIQNDYNLLKSKGLTYTDFKKINSVPITLFQRRILSKITKDFYERNFLNLSNKYNEYNEFLEHLDLKIKGELKDNYDLNQSQISSIIPIYTENSDDLGKGSLSDFKFVNIIENMLYKYNLSSSSSIGVKSISKIKDFSDSKTESDLSSDIYMIALPLKIEGRKGNIINFIQSINKMGKTSLCTLDDVEKQNKGCIREGQLVITNLNIFSEVSNIKMDKYIDSSSYVSSEEKGKNLIQILTETNQKRENYELELKLLFYVQGLPNYKLKETINYIIGSLDKNKNLTNNEKEDLKRTNFYAIKSRVKLLKSRLSNNKLALRKLNEIDFYLNNVSKKLILINRDITKGKNLLKHYKQVEQYKSIFGLISDKLDNLEKLKNK